MSKLIVSLPYPSLADNGNTPYQYVLANDAQNRGKSGTATLNELPKADATILVVPARALSWHQVDLPKVPKARLRAALDGILEERLLDDTNAMAFALSPEAQTGKAAKALGLQLVTKFGSRALYKHLTLPAAALPKWCLSFGHKMKRKLWCLAPQKKPGSPVRCTRGDDYAVAPGDTSGVLGALLADFPSETPILAEPAVVALAESSLSHKIELRQQAQGRCKAPHLCGNWRSLSKV